MIRIIRNYRSGKEWHTKVDRLRTDMQNAIDELTKLTKIATAHGVTLDQLQIAPIGFSFGEKLRPWRNRGYSFLVTPNVFNKSKTSATYWPVVVPGKTNPYNNTQLRIMTEHFALERLSPGEIEKFPAYSEVGTNIVVQYLNDAAMPFRSWTIGSERPVLKDSDKLTYEQVASAIRDKVELADKTAATQTSRSGFRPVKLPPGLDT